jgi:hydrogenase small subunit
MPKTLYWIQAASYGDDTWSMMNAHTPDPVELFDAFDIEVLWHQVLSTTSTIDLTRLNRRILDGDQQLDILCMERSIINPPDGSGRFDMLPEGPRKTFIHELARRAYDLDASDFFNNPLDTEALEAEIKNFERALPRHSGS